jgi:hypothetical protein
LSANLPGRTAGQTRGKVADNQSSRKGSHRQAMRNFLKKEDAKMFTVTMFSWGMIELIIRFLPAVQ